MFIHHNTDQLILPTDVEYQIPKNHLSRIIHTAIEKMDNQLLFSQYTGGGRLPFHPKMMLKVILKYQQIVTTIEQVSEEDRLAEQTREGASCRINLIRKNRTNHS